MDPTLLDTLVSFVDIVVVICAVGILAYGVSRGFLRYRRPMPRGAHLIAVGVVLAVIAHLTDAVYQLYWPHSSLDFASSTYSTAWFHWLLSRSAFAMIVVGLLVGIVHRYRMDEAWKADEEELDSLRISEHESDERFRYLFNNTSNSVYCYEFDPPMPVDLPMQQQIERSYDSVLIECNHVFACELGAGDPAHVVGQKLAELESSMDTTAHEAFFSCFVENNYRLSNFELVFSSPAGEGRVLMVNLVGIVRGDRLERMWAVEENVSDLQHTKAELEHRREFQELMASISGRLLLSTYERADEAVRACMIDMAQFIGAERSAIFWLDDMVKNRVEAAYIWSEDSKNPYDDFVSMEMFPMIWKQLRQQQYVRIDSVAAMIEDFSVDRKKLESLGIKAMLVLPLFTDGEFVGGMTLTRLLNEEPWTDDDAQFGSAFSALMANFVLRQRSAQALRDALGSLRHATDRLEAENLYLRGEVELKHDFHEIVGESNAMLQSLRLVEQVASTETPVLILGETGTGKELIARAVHHLSGRGARPLVKVNCAALPENLIESELFGHEKGAFTGAESSKRGRFDLANGSTLFLDEIGEVPMELQAKLLRVLQEGEFERLGGTKTIRVDARIIVATNRNLELAVNNGEFRSDLYYRINTFPIELPALRDRDNDTELLARHFINVHAKRLGKEVREVSAEMMRQLRAYHWPGNVRELEGIIQRALISCSGHVLELAEPLVATELDNGVPKILSSSIVDLKLVERDHIVSVLEDVNWRISGATGAAAQLGLPPSTLRSKMKKLSIIRPL